MEKSGFAKDVEMSIDDAMDLGTARVGELFKKMPEAARAQFLFVGVVELLSRMDRSDILYGELLTKLSGFMKAQGALDFLGLMQDPAMIANDPQETLSNMVFTEVVIRKEIGIIGQDIIRLLKQSDLGSRDDLMAGTRKHYFALGKFGKEHSMLTDEEKAVCERELAGHIDTAFSKLQDSIKKNNSA